MMWLARLRLLVAVAVALILATAGVAVQGRQQPAPEGAREQAKTAPPPKAGEGGAAVPDMAANRALAREQLALIDKALELLRQMSQAGSSKFAAPFFSRWGRRRVETLHRTGAGKAEIVAALEKYVNSLQEEAITERFRQSRQGGTLLEVYDVRFRRMEAEIWLNEEKAR